MTVKERSRMIAETLQDLRDVRCSDMSETERETIISETTYRVGDDWSADELRYR